KEDANVLVNQEILETALENKDDYVYVTLNPETEEIPKELTEKVEDVQGFVHIDCLVALEDEEAFLEERQIGNEVSEEDMITEVEETDVEEKDTTESDEPKKSDEFTEDTAEKESTEESKEIDDSNTEDESEKESVKEKSGKPEEIEEDITEKDNSSLKMRNNSKIEETNTSLLGHINSGQANIYKTIGGSSFKAGSEHTNKVYYIKKQAKYGNE